MTTILRASPHRFVSTPAIERVALRALRYLHSGFSVHLRGPAGTGKTTLALHLADLLERPLMLLFGDDEFKTSDLIGSQSGYTRKKVVDNFIHSVVKVEDELRQNWVDARLTLACREGLTLVYDEFNRSRPEVNNVLLSALEEKLLVLPPSGGRSDYIRVHPQFRAILTSNPEEYCGVHATQDALLDRLITIEMPEPDGESQQEIIVGKTRLDGESAARIVQLVRAFRQKTGAEKTSGLRSGLILAKICYEHNILVDYDNPEFREICADILLSRAGIPLRTAAQLLWEVFNEQSDKQFYKQANEQTNEQINEQTNEHTDEQAAVQAIAAQPVIQEPIAHLPQSRLIPRTPLSRTPPDHIPAPDSFEPIDELDFDGELEALSGLIQASPLESQLQVALVNSSSQSNSQSNSQSIPQSIHRSISSSPPSRLNNTLNRSESREDDRA